MIYQTKYLDLHENQRLSVAVKEQIYDDDSADNDDVDMLDMMKKMVMKDITRQG